MTARLIGELRHSQALNAKLAHENALLRCMKFAAKSEPFNAQQRCLLDEEIEADLAAVSEEIAQLQPPASAPAVVCDDFSGYKQSFTQGSLTEAGCQSSDVNEL